MTAKNIYVEGLNTYPCTLRNAVHFWTTYFGLILNVISLKTYCSVKNTFIKSKWKQAISILDKIGVLWVKNDMA